MTAIETTPNSAAPAEGAVRDALNRALGSVPLTNSPRLQDFLTYVVEESLAGRAGRIAGKTIVQDVYGRDPLDGQDNIVRVDARRLRRALTEYYRGDGAEDPVQIQIDSGGYAPRFETVDGPNPNPAQPRGLVLLGGLAAGLLIVLGAVWVITRPSEPSQPPVATATLITDRGTQERLALASKSIATLQAANMVQQGSELLFPLADIQHQQAAERLFRDAIRIDPTYADGYAGAAHSLSTLAMLVPDADRRAALLEEATAMTARAVELDPASGWTVSASAWLAFARRDLEQALTLSARAASLADQDGRVLDYQALIHLLTGDFVRAAALADPSQPRKVVGGHMAHLNIYGVARFHMGDHAEAITSFNHAIELGGPVSELTLVYKAAAYQADGRRRMAREMLDELARTWPSFRPDLALSLFYVNQAAVSEVLGELHAAGWQAPG